MPATQQVKYDAIEAAQFDTAGVRFASVDFREEDWAEQLLTTGFDSARMIDFHRGSVNGYLEDAVVRATNTQISALWASEHRGA